MLHSQLYGRARDSCVGISQDVVESEEGSQAIVDDLFQRDPLSVVKDVHKDVNDLLSTRRNTNESFRNFESRFTAQLAKFNSYGSSTKLPKSQSPLMLSSNAAVESSQRISVLAAASPDPSKFTHVSAMEDYMKAVSYSRL